MNIENVFNALEEDQDNSALGIICAELETQGYSVEIDGVPVSSKRIFEGGYMELEKKLEPLAITLFRGGKVEQRFAIEFIEYHEISVKKIEG
jgi:hypothetical protein